MSDAKHTPGPWKWHDGYDTLGLVREGKPIPVGVPALAGLYGPKLEEIVYGEWNNCSTAGANCSNNADKLLIAAAPDLLAACEAWDTGFVDGEQFDAEQFRVWVNERRAMARAAIAKAKGGAA